MGYPQIADYSGWRPTKEQLGPFVGVMRYLEGGGPRMDLTVDEVKFLHSCGKSIGLIWELGTDDARGGFNAGVEAAKRANAEADKLGAPKTVTIFYTVDSDIDGSVVRPYFEGIKSVAGRPASGYGPRRTVDYLLDAGLIQHGWQARGWAYNTLSTKASLHQYQTGTQVDWNDQFKPFPMWAPATPVSTPTTTAATVLQVLASQIGTLEGKNADGSWNNIQPYGAWYGMNGQPWCSMFLSWGFWKAGVLNVLFPKSAWVPGVLEWFRTRKLTGHWPPQPGDIGFVRKYYDGAWHTPHIFIVEKYLGNGRVQTIEGNTNLSGSAQGNGVYRLVRQDSENGTGYIYARPNYASAPAPAPATPAPAPAPTTGPWSKPPILPTSQRDIRVANVRPGRKNEDCRRFMLLLWAAMPEAYRKARYTAWMSESSTLYGPVAQKVCQDWYIARHKADPNNWPPAPSMPVWPGPAMIRAIGGRPR